MTEQNLTGKSSVESTAYEPRSGDQDIANTGDLTIFF